MKEIFPVPSYQSAVYHLILYQKTLNSQFDSLSQILGHIEKRTTDHFYHGFFTTAILAAHNFLDEYDHYLKSENETVQEKIESLKRAVKPAIDEVRKWKDLTNFRNHVLAHSFRIREKGYKSVFLDGEIVKYKIPRSVSDLTILIQCIDFVARVIYRCFKLEYELFLNQVTQGLTETITTRLSVPELTAYLNELNSKMQGGLQELYKRYNVS